jgi:hypothetical protein
MRRLVHPTAKLTAVLGTDCGGAVSNAFRLMGIAERELADFERRHPKVDFGPMFLILMPPPSMYKMAVEVYVHHARELLTRFVAGEDLRPGTKAEAMIVCMEISLKKPPGARIAHLYESIFSEVFGADKMRQLTEVTTREPWPGSTAEILADARRDLANPKRVVS